eukprot:1140933-Pelagomonas_calceolata.AAC.8
MSFFLRTFLTSSPPHSPTLSNTQLTLIRPKRRHPPKDRAEAASCASGNYPGWLGSSAASCLSEPPADASRDAGLSLHEPLMPPLQHAK